MPSVDNRWHQQLMTNTANTSKLKPVLNYTPPNEEGLTLRELRTINKCPLFQMAKHIGVASSQLSQWEQDNLVNRLPSVIKVAKGYYLSLRGVAIALGEDVTEIPKDLSKNHRALKRRNLSLKQLRKLSGYSSRYEVCWRADIATTNLENWEDGINYPTFLNLLKLTRVYKQPLKIMFDILLIDTSEVLFDE